MITSVARVDVERRVTVDVENGPVLRKSYGKRAYRLDRVVLTYRRRDEEPWDEPRIDLSGPYVKKDGSDGVDRNTEFVFRSQHDAFDWLPSLIELYRPEVQS